MAESEDDAAELAELGSQVLDVMDAETVVVTLENGKTVKGSLTGLVLKKKTRKENVSWSGKLSVETDSGDLEMDCANVKSIAAG
ncbi:MAG TPA: hypothetical protein VKR31_06860 [Rhizomicrobium sp.]|nr:hypothetical protein [Rhizomicrobium sp.]